MVGEQSDTHHHGQTAASSPRHAQPTKHYDKAKKNLAQTLDSCSSSVRTRSGPTWTPPPTLKPHRPPTRASQIEFCNELIAQGMQMARAAAAQAMREAEEQTAAIPPARRRTRDPNLAFIRSPAKSASSSPWPPVWPQPPKLPSRSKTPRPPPDRRRPHYREPPLS